MTYTSIEECFLIGIFFLFLTNIFFAKKCSHQNEIEIDSPSKITLWRFSKRLGFITI